MPRKKDDTEKTESQKVRISSEVRQRANLARRRGGHDNTAESTFLGYLIKIGLAKYESLILPVETEGKVNPSEKGATATENDGLPWHETQGAPVKESAQSSTHVVRINGKNILPADPIEHDKKKAEWLSNKNGKAGDASEA